MPSLSTFLSHLFQNGKVEVGNSIEQFEKQDLNTSAQLLRNFYEIDQLHIPGKAPNFDEDAALWAAEYLYLTIQFSVLRHLDEGEITKHLLPWSKAYTPDVIYSVDLTMRVLPSLFAFIVDLSPGDPLVILLKKTAAVWTFSSVGIPNDEFKTEGILLQHTGLAQAYIDRIIAKKDLISAQREAISPMINSALGEYAALLWPEWHDKQLSTTN